jgi:uncharacterized protein YbjT (DUF2867 family)
LTEPRSLTFAEAIAVIARAAGREIRYLQVSIEDYVGRARASAAPADFGALIK